MQTNRVVTTEARQTCRVVLVTAIAVSVLLLAAYPAQAGEKTIYDLTSSAQNPESEFIADSSGVLYSTTALGGSANLGAVFSLTPPGKGQKEWTETTLYAFQGGSDGSFPTGALTPDGSGGYFSTTVSGGGGPCDSFGDGGGCGTIFHLTPPGEGQSNWTETVLYQFQSVDGAYPFDRLVLDSSTGVLYGTTYAGGSSNGGAVFALTPPSEGQTNWTETVLYSFTGGADGGFPFGYVTADETGALYATTTSGGFTGNGTVFKLTPPSEGQTNWTESVLYSFFGWGVSDGASPSAGLIFDPSGNLYSSTAAGGFLDYGTVFELSPESPSGCPTGTYQGNGWCESQIYAFGGEKDGALASSDLIMDANGAIYGTTQVGGKSNDGTVFKLTPPGEGQTDWTEKLLATFKGTDGSYPLAGLLAQKAGKKVVLYGNTFIGGGASCDGGCGAAYEITNSGFVF
jgi:uncharacterized repeat protein (TIGR03803 family)